MEEKLVEIAQYDNSQLAHVDQGILSDAGIQACIENENLSVAGLYYPMAACAVKLLVRQSDQEKARQILKEVQEAGPIEEGPDVPEVDQENNG